MKFLPRRYLEEFFLYSSQFVLFFIIILFTSPSVIRPASLPLVTLTGFLLLQIGLLARFGHRPLARFLFSFMTPFGYSIMQSLSGPILPLDMASFFLWATAFYLGAIQALGLLFHRKWPKRIAELFLTLGTVFTFIFFYFYLDLRTHNVHSYTDGTLSYEGLMSALALSNFLPAFGHFGRSTQNIFFMFGALIFGLFQVSDKVKQISLKARLDSICAIVEPPRPEFTARAALAKGERRDVAILYADLWNFTPIAEKEGPAGTISLLNRYYSMWDVVVRKHRGIVDQFVGDTVIAVFGLMGEPDYADSAVDCALDFLTEFSYLQEDLAEHRLPLIKHIGIGVHAGKVAAGELTSASGAARVAVVGEAVNMAARLDSLCREFKQDILVSASAYKLLSLERQSHLQAMGEVLFRGKTQPQAVFGRK
ncbi:MAG: hypothetical protein KBB32_08240 [Spirochaetia bacterium]|nr:hypothetical protein [Spirochaetia bacterium]